MDTAEARTASRPPPVLAGAVAATVVVGTVFRFWTRSPMWLDEALTVNIAKLPLSSLPDALRHDGAPPLYYVLLHGWMALFGTGNGAVRALSGVFSLAALPVIWWVGRRLGGRPVAWTALVLLASSPFAARYATEARMYALVVLLVLAGFLALMRALEMPSLGRLAVVSVVTGLLLLTHYWTPYLLAAVTGWLAITAVRRRGKEGGTATAPARAAAAVVAGGVLFLPWVPSFLYQLKHTGTPWAPPAGFSAVVTGLGEFTGGDSDVGRALVLLFFTLAGLALFGRGIDDRRVELDLRTRPLGRPLAVAFGVTLALAIVAGIATRSAFQPRYMAVLFPVFLVLVALGTPVLLDRRLRVGVVAAAVVLGLAGSAVRVGTRRTQASVVAHAIDAAARPGDVIAYCPDQLGPAVDRLLRGRYQQVTFPRLSGPQRVDWVDYASTVARTDPAAFADAVLQRAGPGHDVWLVWSADYRTLEGKCEDVVNALSRSRPGVQAVRPDANRFYEHAELTRFRSP